METKKNILHEPEALWGGPWTKRKLDAFIDYVQAYLKIMKKYPKWKTIYFDGFAGSGEKFNKKNNEQFPFDFSFDDITQEEIDVYKGSVSRVLELEDTFDYYYFIDTNIENIASIKNLIKKNTRINSNRIAANNDDCNNQLIKLAKALKTEKYAALIFIDPFGMQVNWESIESLKDTRSDIWILIPSGVIINRMLPKSGEGLNESKLEKFFGIKYEDIKDTFYSKKSVDTLFGNENKTNKISNPIDKIVAIYTRQLKTVWKNVIKSPLVLKNSKNAAIFHLLFASNNKTAVKIASEIVEKKQI